MPSKSAKKMIDGCVILDHLGKGAKSQIWKVQDPGTGEIYAVKRVIKECEEDERYFEQTRTEHQIGSKVNHAYLRKAFKLSKIKKWMKTQEMLLFLEYVEGRTLKQISPSNIHDIIRIFIKLARGLDVLHQMGFVHADIKPKNILLTDDGLIKIIDFGQCCPIGHRKTRIQGTPDYMAPEQVERGPLDQRTDVFNYGASLYWVLTGKNIPTNMPRHTDPDDLAVNGPVREAPHPHEIDPTIPTALSRLAMDCCQAVPVHRPESMQELIARLEVVRQLLKAQKKVRRRQKTARGEDITLFTTVSNDDTDDLDRVLEGIY